MFCNEKCDRCTKRQFFKDNLFECNGLSCRGRKKYCKHCIGGSSSSVKENELKFCLDCYIVQTEYLNSATKNDFEKLKVCRLN